MTTIDTTTYEAQAAMLRDALAALEADRVRIAELEVLVRTKDLVIASNERAIAELRTAHDELPTIIPDPLDPDYEPLPGLKMTPELLARLTGVPDLSGKTDAEIEALDTPVPAVPNLNG